MKATYIGFISGIVAPILTFGVFKSIDYLFSPNLSAHGVSEYLCKNPLIGSFVWTLAADAVEQLRYNRELNEVLSDDLGGVAGTFLGINLASHLYF